MRQVKDDAWLLADQMKATEKLRIHVIYLAISLAQPAALLFPWNTCQGIGWNCLAVAGFWHTASLDKTPWEENIKEQKKMAS